MPTLHPYLDQAKIIFWDAGGTLFYPYPSVGVLYAEAAARYGAAIPADKIQMRFNEVWKKRHGLAALSSHSSEKIERDWWRHLVHEVFDALGGVRDFENFFDELYNLFASPECWRLYDESLEVLETIRQTGKKMAMISNWDSRLFRLCRELGVEKYMDFILASAVFGASKPGKAIFEEALLRSGVKPHEAVHIGDSYEDDVLGATRVGMKSVWLDRHDFVSSGKTPEIETMVRVESLKKLWS